MQFQFKCSYLDQREFEVLGHPTIRSVEEYSAAQHTLDYFRTIFNHGDDPTSFEREILARQGGVRCGYPAAHWLPEVWDAYCAFKRRSHEEALAHHAEMVEKYGSGWPNDPPTLLIPRPIYFDHLTHRWETEPWYDPSQTAKAAA